MKQDKVYIVNARDNFYDPDNEYILTATNDINLAHRHRNYFEKHNPEGVCSIFAFEDGLRLAEIF